MSAAPAFQEPTMRDGFGRRIEYLRISVTDRCDLRCRYCMAEKMTFLPRSEVLSLEEIAILADRFIARGVVLALADIAKYVPNFSATKVPGFNSAARDQPLPVCCRPMDVHRCGAVLCVRLGAIDDDHGLTHQSASHCYR